jgi:hypothetical protein
MTTRNCKAPVNEIASLNDALRRTFTGGKVFMTAAVAALPEEQLARVLDRVRTFDQFTEDNDPYGEHDFGSFELDGERFFFKCDYYNEDMSAGSEDASDPKQTTRLLTLGFMAEC